MSPPAMPYLQAIDDGKQAAKRPCVGHHVVLVGNDGAPIKVVREDGSDTNAYLAVPEPTPGLSFPLVALFLIVAFAVGLAAGHKIGIGQAQAVMVAR